MGNGKNAINKNLFEVKIFRLKSNVDVTVSAADLRSLDVKRRKCYFYDETPLKYFNFYTENLCEMECHIDAAIQFCGCIPFFYNIRKFYLFIMIIVYSLLSMIYEIKW